MTGVASAVLLIGAAGCSTAGPTVELSDVRVADETAGATQLAIGLTVSNPSDEPLRLLTYEYRVRVDGRRWYTGRWSAQQTLQPGATATATIPAAGPPPSGSKVSVRGRLRYVRPGEIAEVLLDTGLRRPKASFGGEGVIGGDGG